MSRCRHINVRKRWWHIGRESFKDTAHHRIHEKEKMKGESVVSDAPDECKPFLHTRRQCNKEDRKAGFTESEWAGWALRNIKNRWHNFRERVARLSLRLRYSNLKAFMQAFILHRVACTHTCNCSRIYLRSLGFIYSTIQFL